MQIQSVYAMELADARRVIAEHGWARVVTSGEHGLRATYAFCLLENASDQEIVVACHFARADPQCEDIEAGTPALAIFEGPYGFISASWYRPELTDIPSTMNHVSVHLHGTPEVLDGDAAFDVLRRTLERHEDALGETAWRLEGGGLATAERIAPQTVTFRLRTERVEAKAKLSQKMPLAVRERIIDQLDGSGPHAHPALAAWMRELSLD